MLSNYQHFSGDILIIVLLDLWWCWRLYIACFWSKRITPEEVYEL